MLNNYLGRFRISGRQNANRTLEFLAKIPFLKNKIKDDYTKEEKKKFIIMGEIFSAIWEILKIYAFVLVFMFIPKLCFAKYMKVGASGFGLEDCLVYFTVIMCCFAGSLLHSKLFTVTEESVIALKQFYMTPKYYFRSLFLKRFLVETIGFGSIFTILGMNPLKSVYMVIIIALSRTVGESINILFYRISKKRITELKTGIVLIMLLALFVSYFVPFLRGCVPAAYDIVFNTLWIVIILIVGGVFAYYMWNNDYFNRIATEVHTNTGLLIEYDDDSVSVKQRDTIAKDKEDSARISKYHGDEYMYNLFFTRNRKLFRHYNLIKLIVIAVAFVVALVAGSLGFGNTVKKVIAYSLPVLVFVMYLICNPSRYCREIYNSCDIHIRKKESDKFENINNFVFCFRKTMLVNLVPTVALVLTYIIVSVAVAGITSPKLIIEICAIILLLSVLFTLYGFAVYYLTDNNRNHTIAELAMYLVCYGCIFIKTSELKFTLGVGLFTAILIMLMVTAVFLVGKNRKNEF